LNRGEATVAGGSKLSPSPLYSGERVGVTGRLPTRPGEEAPHPNPLPCVQGRGDIARRDQDGALHPLFTARVARLAPAGPVGKMRIMLPRFYSKRAGGGALTVLLALAAIVAGVVLAQPATQDAPPPPATQRAAPPGTSAPSADEVLGRMLKPRRDGQEREVTYNEPPAADK